MSLVLTMKKTLARWLDSDVGYSFRTSPMAMVAALIALVCVFCSIRVGYIDGAFKLIPLIEVVKESALDLVVAGTQDAVLMVESEA